MSGLSYTLEQYFKKKLGRKKKKKITIGAAFVAAKALARQPTLPDFKAAVPKQKKKRANTKWDSGEDGLKMFGALKMWCEKAERAAWEAQNKGRGLRGFAMDNGIPRGTFRDYVDRVETGSLSLERFRISRGRPPVLDPYLDQVIEDSTIARDRLSEGHEPRQICDQISSVHAELSPTQVRNAYQYRSKKWKRSKRLTAPKVPQATTSDRIAAVTVEQQRRWFAMLEAEEKKAALDAVKYPSPTGETYEQVSVSVVASVYIISHTILSFYSSSWLLISWEILMKKASRQVWMDARLLRSTVVWQGADRRKPSATLPRRVSRFR